MRTVAIVQARTGSTRLPRKVLLDLAGEPVLARVMRRLARTPSLHSVWVATTNRAEDDVIVELCENRGWPYHRGSEDDVLDRYHGAAREACADVIVRVSSDCPLVDPEVTAKVVGELAEGATYSTNSLPVRTFPIGLDVEAFGRDALETASREASAPADREHVTPFLRRHAERFPQRYVQADGDFSHHRWTLDTEDDYALLRRIYDHFGHDAFSWREALRLVTSRPEWVALNAHVAQKNIDAPNRADG